VAKKNIFLRSLRERVSYLLSRSGTKISYTNWIKKTRVVSCFSEAITPKFSILSTQNTHTERTRFFPSHACVRCANIQIFRCDKTSLHFIAVDYTLLRFHWCAIRSFFYKLCAERSRMCRKCRALVAQEAIDIYAYWKWNRHCWQNNYASVFEHTKRAADARLSNIPKLIHM
jgi:hypothetical protein